MCCGKWESRTPRRVPPAELWALLASPSQLLRANTKFVAISVLKSWFGPGGAPVVVEGCAIRSPRPTRLCYRPARRTRSSPLVPNEGDATLPTVREPRAAQGPAGRPHAPRERLRLHQTRRSAAPVGRRLDLSENRRVVEEI